MKHRSSSHDNRRIKRKRNKSNSLKYDSSSDGAVTPERLRRRRSPSSPPSRYAYEKHDEYRSSKEKEKSYASYKVLCVSALHAKASDEVIKEALYSEYKKFGDLSIRISHDLEERVAYVCFRNAEDAREAKRAKPRVIIYDKVALVEPVYESANRSSVERLDRYRARSRQRSRSYTPPYDRHRRSPVAELYRTERFYDRIPYAPLPIPPRDFARELPMHPEFLPRPPLHPALPPPHLPLGPHLYGMPRPFFPFKPIHPQFFDRFDKRDRFPNYLHHVPPEEDPLATRTLFVGNLELGITDDELRRMFNRHGVVEDVDIKRPVPGTGNAYAFVRFKNLDMAHKAKVELSGQYIGKFQCKIGYGKATPTTRIWVGGLGLWTSIAQLEREFDRFGAIKKIDYDKPESCAYILYDSVDAATAAVKEMRGFPLGGSEHKLRVDFADIGSRQSNSKSQSQTLDDAVVSAGDYRQRLNRDSFYDPYDPWNSADYGYGRSHEEPSGSDGKYNKDSYRSRSPSESRDKNWKKDYPEIKRRHRSSSHNSDDNISDEFTNEDIIRTSQDLMEIARKAKSLWKGGLILKSSLFPAEFYLTDGDREIVSSLNGKNTQLLRITQRLRLDQSKLDDVTKRMANSTSYAIFIGLCGSSTSLSFDDSSLQTRPLRNLISYLKQKEAAGVISLISKDGDITGVLYAFPPCEYASNLLKRTAHNLTDETLKEDHLVIIVVKGEIAG